MIEVKEFQKEAKVELYRIRSKREAGFFN